MAGLSISRQASQVIIVHLYVARIPLDEACAVDIEKHDYPTRGRHMMPSTIAIIADCDGTLAPDTTGQLLTQCGADPKDLFERANSLVKQGWCQPLAYMHEMIQLTKPEQPLAGLTQSKIQEIGQSLDFYPGVPEFFHQIKETIENQPEFREARIRVEAYVISGGN